MSSHSQTNAALTHALPDVPLTLEGSATLHLYVGLKAYDALSREYQVALQTACAEANQWMTTKYDLGNPQALKRLVATGSLLRPFSGAIMDASFKAANELYGELAQKSAEFKKIYDPWVKFRDEQVLWFRICENGFDNYMATANARANASAQKKA